MKDVTGEDPRVQAQLMGYFQMTAVLLTTQVVITYYKCINYDGWQVQFEFSCILLEDLIFMNFTVHAEVFRLFVVKIKGFCRFEKSNSSIILYY